QQIAHLDADERAVCQELATLVKHSGSTLGELCGLSTRSVAELLVEVGDPRRYTEGGFARFSGSAPLPASTAEGPGEPSAIASLVERKSFADPQPSAPQHDDHAAQPQAVRTVAGVTGVVA